MAKGLVLDLPKKSIMFTNLIRIHLLNLLVLAESYVIPHKKRLREVAFIVF